MRPTSVPLRSLRLPRPSTSSLRRFTVSPSSAAAASSSTAGQQQYTPPVEPGVLPAYDLCLQYIRDNAAAKRAQVPALRQELEELRAGVESVEEEEDREALLAKIASLERKVRNYDAGAGKFDPEVRFEFESGQADPSTDSFRYLDQERFELGGTLDQHVQRLNGMHVVPDVCDVGDQGLSVDLCLRFPAPPPKPKPVPDEFGWIKSRSDRVVVVRDPQDGDRLLTGSLLTVGEVRPQPEIEIRYFSANPTYGTLVMVDPDVPDPVHHSFKEKLHWLVPNIELSSSNRIYPSPSFAPSSPQHNATLPEALVPYLPPHPHKGSPVNHRYVFALVTHSQPIDFEAIGDSWKRSGMTFRGLQAAMQGQLPEGEKALVAGLSFFRAVYDEVECPKIWAEVLKEKELKFTPPGAAGAWTPDPLFNKLNASFERPSPIAHSLALKKRNKAMLYNQRMGIIKSDKDLMPSFVTTEQFAAAEANGAAPEVKEDPKP